MQRFTLSLKGTCIKTTHAAQDLCDGSADHAHYPLYFTAGVHPHHAKVSAWRISSIRR